MISGRDLDCKPPETIAIGTSRLTDAHGALKDIVEQIGGAKPSFVLLFVPSTLALDELSKTLPQMLPGTTVFGCTTAGQITSHGYEGEALVAIAFRRDHFRVASKLFKPVSPVSIADVVSQTERLVERFGVTPGRKRLALVFTDGLSKQEDLLVAALETGLKDIPVFGGSAGDGLAFERTFVLHDGQFHTNAALLLLIETDLSYRGLGFDHFQPTDKRMVVTRAIPEERLVLEINGSPAASEYARLVKVPLEDLSPIVFAENPVLVRNRNLYHVRGIQQIHENGGLTFLSAIDDGLLLTLGSGKEIIRTLDSSLAACDDRGEEADFVLGFDCYLRKLEITHKGLDEEASQHLRRHRVVGFNTYGEQHLGVHVNQTFVGVAFFRPGEEVMP
ncbi:FIST N-terminal domain-containing protein [Notoacmeibacter sp. MSK16QG-6]|uniref:FIST N-terminal domain-containing protein n=1 Tax=Notoacmeibacter sp. MSK16QG-6 TaxID=2957982 RepID=UPI00209FC0A0|nr:FIST N-terminal domain-containing protein [Notoacmeibacter sp. MSK16QG-6]